MSHRHPLHPIYIYIYNQVYHLHKQAYNVNVATKIIKSIMSHHYHHHPFHPVTKKLYINSSSIKSVIFFLSLYLRNVTYMSMLVGTRSLWHHSI